MKTPTLLASRSGAEASDTPAILGTLRAAQPTGLKSGGQLITPDVSRWLGSETEVELLSRWVPKGIDPGDLGGTMTIGFEGSEPSSAQRADEPLAADAEELAAFAGLKADDGSDPLVTFVNDQMTVSEILHYAEYLRSDDSPETLSRVVSWAEWSSAQKGDSIIWTGDLTSMHRAGAWLSAEYHPEMGLHTVQLALGFRTFRECLEAMRKVTSGCLPLAEEPVDFIGFPIEIPSNLDRVEIEHSWWRSKQARYQVVSDFRAVLPRYDGIPARSGCFLTAKKFLQ